ncbi:MAG TPA: RNA-binding protein [Hyphomicrobium sp.]
MGADDEQHIRDDRREEGASLRRCIVTRKERAPDDLIRFVVDPSGAVVPDLARKLPGRGVWVTADKASVAAAVKANAFAKSLKRQVTAAADLPERVEFLFVKRVLEALSLANKAGLVATGFDKVETLLDAGRAAVLLHGSDAASDGTRRLDRKFAAVQRDKGQTAPVVDWLTIDQLSLAIGRSNVVHAGLKQGGATNRFLREAERLRRYRSGTDAS